MGYFCLSAHIKITSHVTLTPSLIHNLPLYARPPPTPPHTHFNLSPFRVKLQNFTFCAVYFETLCHLYFHFWQSASLFSTFTKSSVYSFKLLCKESASTTNPKYAAHLQMKVLRYSMYLNIPDLPLCSPSSLHSSTYPKNLTGDTAFCCQSKS